MCLHSPLTDLWVQICGLRWQSLQEAAKATELPIRAQLCCQNLCWRHQSFGIPSPEIKKLDDPSMYSLSIEWMNFITGNDSMSDLLLVWIYSRWQLIVFRWMTPLENDWTNLSNGDIIYENVILYDQLVSRNPPNEHVEWFDCKFAKEAVNGTRWSEAECRTRPRVIGRSLPVGGPGRLPPRVRDEKALL